MYAFSAKYNIQKITKRRTHSTQNNAESEKCLLRPISILNVDHELPSTHLKSRSVQALKTHNIAVLYS